MMRIVERLGLMGAMLLAAAMAHAAPNPADFEADKIVGRELPMVRAAMTVDGLNGLRARYLSLRATSDHPEAYDCLLGMLEPKNSPQALRYLGRAVKENESFYRARLAYAEWLHWRNPGTSRGMIQEAWLLNALDPDVLRAWGAMQLDQGKEDRVRAAIAPLLRQNVPSEEAAVGAFFEGRLAWRDQDWQRAQEGFTVALNALPYDTEIRAWWIRMAASSGHITEAAEAIRARQSEPLEAARLQVALAGALNSLARRELAPREAPVPLKTAAWRQRMVDEADAVREWIPFAVAWDVARLGQWNEVARGRYARAWDRFEERVPMSLSIMSTSDTAGRFRAIDQAIEAVELGRREARTQLALAMEEAGWTAEALEVARQAVMHREESDALMRQLAALEAHQGYLATLAEAFDSYPGEVLTRPPWPQQIIPALSPFTKQRHPASGASSENPLIQYLRDHNQYLSWMSEPYEERSYRLMTIVMEDPGFPVGMGNAVARVDVVVGEDLIEPAGVAARQAAMRDVEERDHCHVSINCEELLHDLFIQQADRAARVRLEAHFQSGEPWKHLPFMSNDEPSPDTLAVMAQKVFESQALGPAAQPGAPAVSMAEAKILRERIIEGLADVLARRTAYRLAVDQKALKVKGDKDVKAGAYAIAQSQWPYLGWYHAYREALAGNGDSRELVEKMLEQARDAGMIRDDQPPMLQAHWLTEDQVRQLAESVYEG